MKFLKWLYPGMGVKRWLLLTFVGTLFVGAGLSIVNNSEVLGLIEKLFRQWVFSLTGKYSPQLSGLIVILFGIILVVVGFKRTIHSMISVLIPENEDKLVEILHQKNQLKRGPKIVVIGGGTGLSVLLRGLKEYTSNITAVVTVADDGGSSGKLRGELGILPPGDIRNCLVALADREKSMEELLQYRFGVGTGLAGHSLGNLLIAALAEISGGFEKAIREISKVMAIRGQVLPSTLKSVVLCAQLEDGTTVKGESAVSRSNKKITKVYLEPADCFPLNDAISAIEEADAIVLGPGSLYTSIIPNLLVKGIPEAIKKSKALKIYACNIMTQPGETDHYTASQHLKIILDYVGVNVIDYAIVNVEVIPKRLIKKYREEGSNPVQPDLKEVQKLGVKVAQAKMVYQSNVVRHDSQKLSKAVISLVFRETGKKQKVSFLDWYILSNRLKKGC